MWTCSRWVCHISIDKLDIDVFILIWLIYFSQQGALQDRVWTSVSLLENVLIPVSVFDAPTEKQNKCNGVKEFPQCTSCGCSLHPPAALCWCSSSSQLCSQMDVCRRSCGWTQPSVFRVPPSWCEGPAHTWIICLIVHSSSKDFDICLMSLFFSLSKHCPSSRLLVFSSFQMVLSWILMTFLCSSFVFRL